MSMYHKSNIWFELFKFHGHSPGKNQNYVKTRFSLVNNNNFYGNSKWMANKKIKLGR